MQRHDTKLLAILETVGMLLCDTWKVWCLCFDRGSHMSSVKIMSSFVSIWLLNVTRHWCTWMKPLSVCLFSESGDSYDSSIVHEILQISFKFLQQPLTTSLTLNSFMLILEQPSGNMVDFGDLDLKIECICFHFTISFWWCCFFGLPHHPRDWFIDPPLPNKSTKCR